MLAGEDFVAHPHDEILSRPGNRPALKFTSAADFLTMAYAGDHLARDQILADAEVLQRALALCAAPQLVGFDVDGSQAIVLDTRRWPWAHPCNICDRKDNVSQAAEKVGFRGDWSVILCI